MNAPDTAVGIDVLPTWGDRLEQRFILTQIDRFTLVFPSTIVADISIVERSHILTLPFYNSAILGAIYHDAQIMLLISLHQILAIPANVIGERLIVVRLAHTAGELAGVGLVIARTLGMRSLEELPPDLFNVGLPGSTSSEPNMRLFHPQMLGSQLWQPQRWR
jgi:hypothetical protein